jgi:hypothetical protein
MKHELKETMACQVMTEVCLDSKEPNLEHIEFKVDYEEVPKEDVAVETGKVPKKQHRG